MSRTSAHPIELKDAAFQWLPGGYRVTFGLREYITQYLSPSCGQLLPYDMNLVLGPGIDDCHLDQFISAMIAQVRRDVAVWQERFALLNSRTRAPDDIASYADLLRRCQPWLILVTEHGGFGGTETTACAGVVTCSTRSNHGVAWSVAADGSLDCVLLTTRAQGSDWDWDSDIGHELTHAALAPVPIFTQNVERASREARLVHSCARDLSSMSDIQISRLIYIASEVLVTSMRGEQRFTSTGLPEFSDIEEFHIFLEILDNIAPKLGFSEAIEQLSLEKTFYVGRDFDIFPTILPILRFLTRMRDQFDKLVPPKIEVIVNKFSTPVVSAAA